MVRTANAKVNIILKITGVRPDGYHELDMIFLGLKLGDKITMEPRPEGISLTCSDPSLPADEGNLAWRAASRMIDRFGLRSGVAISIEKAIPAQAGLGGGSSDAACVLNGMNELFGLNASDAELAGIALSLGADVPFLLKGGCARARGTGEQLEPIGSFPDCTILLAKPEVSVSTPWAYHAFDTQAAAFAGDAALCVEAAENAIRTGDLAGLGRSLCNDLEPPVTARYPVIGQIRRSMLDLGAAGALMTGSGSAVFGLFEDEETAAEAAETIRRDHHAWTALTSPA